MTQISPTSGAAGAQDVVGSPPAAGLASDRDTFLRLLVAQLRHQDLFSPVDPTTFVAQTAQFSMVERLEEIAAQGRDAALANRLTMSAALVGRTVVYTAASGVPETGRVDAAWVDDGHVVLQVAGIQVPVSSVLTIGAPT